MGDQTPTGHGGNPRQTGCAHRGKPYRPADFPRRVGKHIGRIASLVSRHFGATAACRHLISRMSRCGFASQLNSIVQRKEQWMPRREPQAGKCDALGADSRSHGANTGFVWVPGRGRSTQWGAVQDANDLASMPSKSVQSLRTTQDKPPNQP